MENEENPKTKFTQLLASFSSFLRGHKTFADLLNRAILKLSDVSSGVFRRFQAGRESASTRHSKRYQNVRKLKNWCT